MRKHRFESFNERVAKLNIDPVRQSHDIDADMSDTTSYLQIGLSHWKDMNMSENFTNFVRQLEPVCDSLAHILHHHNYIMEMLTTYIDKKDALSLEPLLDMLGRFAHDLGIRFEAHFASAVTLVGSLAASHNDIQVVEWSFTCLAWLFKFLSRLLVPDLRPLFQIMAPFLGKVPQKIHTTRFAAEAMSFLLKKAAIIYHKNQLPLIKIIDCIFEHLESIDDDHTSLDLYHHGLMTLLFESIKGIERRLHSSGDSIYRCLIERYLHRDASSAKIEPIIKGLTIALIHHTDATNFAPILELILRGFQNGQKRNTTLQGHLLFIAAAVRGGSRIKDWSEMLDALPSLLAGCPVSNEEETFQTFQTAALLLQSASLDITLARLRSTMDMISGETNAPYFIPFCQYFFDIGRERFQDLLHSYLSKCVIAYTAHHGTADSLLGLLFQVGKVSSFNCLFSCQN